MTNDQLAEAIVNMAADSYQPMELIGRMADWGSEEWSQIDPEASARRLDIRDRVEIIGLVTQKLIAYNIA